MKYNPDRHHRRSMRLSGHDYSSAGFYFITTCVHQRQCLLGEVAAGQMNLNELGKIVDHEWRRSQQIRPEFQFHEWVVMPNHFHAIIEIPPVPQQPPPVGTTRRSSGQATRQSSSSAQPQGVIPADQSMRPKSISSLMAGFKSTTARQINQTRQTPGAPLWQRRFYDRIIRNETALQTIRQYIANNPASWFQDCFYLQQQQR